MHRLVRLLVCAAAACAVAGVASSKGPRTPVTYTDAGPETTLARVFAAIENNRLDSALDLTESLTAAYPNFRLAHLIKGDLLLARAQPLSTFGAAAQAPEDRRADFRDEALARLHAYRQKPPANSVPRYLLQLEPKQKYALVVDTRRSRLYVFENGDGPPRLIADYYVSSGKAGSAKAREGDKKTPIGVYHVTSSLPQSKLSDFYGAGAYPISYPNEWDRRLGRNGHGIWLHGTPSDTFSRPPRASDGCVVLTNEDLERLAKTLQIGLTPVIISDGIEWMSVGDWQSERASLNQRIDDWRRDWESGDPERYLRHYSRRFLSDSQNYDQWSEHKRRVAAGKTWIKVGVGNLSVFRSPGKDDLVVVTFDQDYRSNNLSNAMKKRQYWIKEDGRWKIVYEGAA